MSDITSAIRDYLKTEPTVTAFVGPRVRTRWASCSDFRGSDGKVRPYIIVLQISGETVHHQGGAMDRMNPRVEAHCFAGVSSDANKLSTAVRGVMDGLTNRYLGRKNLFVRSIMLAVPVREIDEPPEDGSDEAIFRDLLELDVWHEQAVPVFV